MTRFAGTVAILFLALALATGCKRSKPDGPAGWSGGPAPPTPPDAVATDHVFIAHLRRHDIWESDLFKSVQQTVAKLPPEAKMSWPKVEAHFERHLGAKPSLIDTVTLCYPDFPRGNEAESRLVLILACKSAIPRAAPFGLRSVQSGRPGFDDLGSGRLLHFPDDRTMVVVHEAFADRYLAGYAKDRRAWPLSDDFLRAAEGHTLFAAVNLSRAPGELKKGRELRPFAPLFDAKLLTLAVDLRGKELRVGLRANFPNADAAEKGKQALSRAVSELAREVGKDVDDPWTVEDLGAMLGPIKEARRALVEAKVETAGADLTAATVFLADFDLGEVTKSATERVRIAANRVKSQNNLMQIGLGMHNFHSATERLPIWGVDARGPVRDLQGRPLLSWRVALLPYVEQDALYREFKLDEPWDSEHNKKLIARMPKLYAPVNEARAPAGHTFYQQVVGPAAMRPGLRLETITDGTSNTIAVVEAAEPVVWTRPADVFIPTPQGQGPPAGLKQKFGRMFRNGFHVVLWDGSTRLIDTRKISDRTLWSALTPDGGETLGNDW
jgi:hypothetical protein